MTIDIKKLLALSASPELSRWELDNIVWNERTSNPDVLVQFLQRIETLKKPGKKASTEKQELSILESLAEDMDQTVCEELLSGDDEIVRQRFIEKLARKGALETLCNNAISIETMEQMCKLAPNDFILTAKRSQDLINSIQELVIQGETLSNDVAGA
jgi:hypothetical protein